MIIYYRASHQATRLSAELFASLSAAVWAGRFGPAPPAVRRLFNDDLIEEVFRVQEYAFDAVRLRDLLDAWLAEAGVEVRTRTEVEKE